MVARTHAVEKGLPLMSPALQEFSGPGSSRGAYMWIYRWCPLRFSDEDSPYGMIPGDF
jgi:hypothetical protein